MKHFIIATAFALSATAGLADGPQPAPVTPDVIAADVQSASSAPILIPLGLFVLMIAAAN